MGSDAAARAAPLEQKLTAADMTAARGAWRGEHKHKHKEQHMPTIHTLLILGSPGERSQCTYKRRAARWRPRANPSHFAGWGWGVSSERPMNVCGSYLQLLLFTLPLRQACEACCLAAAVHSRVNRRHIFACHRVPANSRP